MASSVLFFFLFHAPFSSSSSNCLHFRVMVIPLPSPSTFLPLALFAWEEGSRPSLGLGGKTPRRLSVNNNGEVLLSFKFIVSFPWDNCLGENKFLKLPSSEEGTKGTNRKMPSLYFTVKHCYAINSLSSQGEGEARKTTLTINHTNYGPVTPVASRSAWHGLASRLESGVEKWNLKSDFRILWFVDVAWLAYFLGRTLRASEWQKFKIWSRFVKISAP